MTVLAVVSFCVVLNSLVCSTQCRIVWGLSGSGKSRAERRAMLFQIIRFAPVSFPSHTHMCLVRREMSITYMCLVPSRPCHVPDGEKKPSLPLTKFRHGPTWGGNSSLLFNSWWSVVGTKTWTFYNFHSAALSSSGSSSSHLDHIIQSTLAPGGPEDGEGDNLKCPFWSSKRRYFCGTHDLPFDFLIIETSTSIGFPQTNVTIQRISQPMKFALRWCEHADPKASRCWPAQFRIVQLATVKKDLCVIVNHIIIT